MLKNTPFSVSSSYAEAGDVCSDLSTSWDRLPTAKPKTHTSLTLALFRISGTEELATLRTFCEREELEESETCSKRPLQEGTISLGLDIASSSDKLEVRTKYFLYATHVITLSPEFSRIELVEFSGDWSRNGMQEQITQPGSSALKKAGSRFELLLERKENKRQ